MKKYLLLILVASMLKVDVIIGCWVENRNADMTWQPGFHSWNCYDGIAKDGMSRFINNRLFGKWDHWEPRWSSANQLKEIFWPF